MDDMREINFGGVKSSDERCINLRDLGFVGRISDEALAEIDRNERRRMREMNRLGILGCCR